jgi:ribokinase
LNKICVLGSINIDIILNVKKMPQVGETIFGENLKNASGGKGANQAIAASRCGAEVRMIGKIGNDNSGNSLIEALVKDSIDVKYVGIDANSPTGTALITVNEEGNNSIIVVPGANMAISHEEILAAKKIIEDSDLVISQFETPIQATIDAFKIAKEKKVITILNPAPAKTIPDELYSLTDILAPNETEIYELSGVKVENLKDAKKAADMFLQKGVKYVIITLGEKGAALIEKDRVQLVPAYKVTAVDTTAAGDSFIGALASIVNKDTLSFDNLIEAIKFGNKVSSVVVQKEGAQPSIPYLSEINRIFGEVLQ